MSIDRRDFLQQASLATSALALVGCESDDGSSGDGADHVSLPTYQYDEAPGPQTLFSHGVASGDPLEDAVIIWTRVSVEASPPTVAVFYEVATDKSFDDRVAAGNVETGPDRDFTVKVDVTGLEPGTSYFYRFFLQGRSSPLGTTRTAPSGAVSTFRAAYCSCAHFASGWYMSYRGIAEQTDLDLVFHLGDYIYEGGSGAWGGGGVRKVFPEKTIYSLDEYRLRYATHRTDLDLQAAHAAAPWVMVWDDHEFANNARPGGAPSHDESKSGPWSERRDAATRSWHEWLPVREQEAGKIWRQFKWGDLVDIFCLDTRMWGRDKQTTGGNKKVLTDPKRTMLGMDQESWLFSGLTSSTATWRLLAQQVMMGPLQATGVVINTDQWDGYQATRERLYAAVDKTPKGSFVVLTGDIHSSWAIELPRKIDQYDAKTGEGAIGVEFITPGITSGGIPGGATLVNLAIENNPNIRWADIEHRGFAVVELDDEQVSSTWFHVADVKDKTAKVKQSKRWVAKLGKTRLNEVK